MTRIRLLVLFLVVFLFLPACEKKEERKPLEPVTLQLKWEHQAQFAGFYVAREKGFYTEEGLDITFLPGGKDVDIAASVISGKAQFSVMAPEDILLKRLQGEKLTAIAVIYRRSAVVYVSLADSNITRPTDLIGKRIAISAEVGSVRDFELQFHALMKKLDIPTSQMTLLPYDPQFGSLIKGDVDVSATYLTGGLIRLGQKGYKLNIIWPGDYGLKMYSDTLVTVEKLIQEKPDLVERFLRATMKGWRQAIGDPEEAVQDTLKYAKVADPELQKAMMDALVPLVHTGEDSIGWMKVEDWRQMHDILLQQGILPKALDVDSVFTMDFLEKINKGSNP